ncbi:MAG TPA: YiiX/YebB-like N1pC/P60 family cysteine hydrolase [Flavobacteriales bacterium]|nr:YiiX/YebB-like N1pC/P60 family cysteine hydrolase [Flavobacteriales bacterium]
MNKWYLLTWTLLLVSCKETNEKKAAIAPPPVKKDVNLVWMTDGTDTSEYKNGDILLIKSKSDLSPPISLATGSEYTHCAVFWQPKFRRNDRAVIIEANQGIQFTPFKEFIQERDGSVLLVMRLKERDKKINRKKEHDFFEKALRWATRPYDGEFRWSDDRLYCSELVYKLYSHIGIRLCPLKKLRDYDLSSPLVKTELEKRYGKNIPYEEPVVAPSDLIYSPLLDTVFYIK